MLLLINQLYHPDEKLSLFLSLAVLQLDVRKLSFLKANDHLWVFMPASFIFQSEAVMKVKKTSPKSIPVFMDHRQTYLNLTC